MAAERLDARPDELTVQAGLISLTSDPERKITYAELMGGKPFNREVSGDAPLKDSKTYTIVGSSSPREDIPGKVAGRPSFIQDLRLPGMLHGAAGTPAQPGGGIHFDG